MTLHFPEVHACTRYCQAAGGAPHGITLQLCMCLPAAGTLAQQAASLAAPLDILVATPQKVLQHAQKGNLFYGDVQWLVLDEADTMLDRWAVTGCQVVQQQWRSGCHHAGHTRWRVPTPRWTVLWAVSALSCWGRQW